MPSQRVVYLRSRLVWPVSAPLIRDGAVGISGNRITWVGRWRDLRPEAKGPVRSVDLGEVVLMPGLVNAHCHLDYTGMAGQFPPPRVFTDWLKTITSTKAGWSQAEYAASWLEGAKMLVRTGTTTVGDIEAVPELLPKAWRSTPLRVLSFFELIGISARREPGTLLQETLAQGQRCHHRRCRWGLSPHAPYSTTSKLLQLTSQAARRANRPLCIHLAESALEYEMFTRGQGEMFEWLRRSGRDTGDCGLGSPTEHLDRCGVLGPNLLVAHANYLGRHDPKLLCQKGVSVAHCPRSHFYFRHGPFPLRRLLRAGVNVCLGTDSLATVYRTPKQVLELNMFEEMQALARREPWVSPRRILQMATLNGARALGFEGKLGAITPSAFADLVAVPYTGREGSLHERLLWNKTPVAASLIDGAWALAPA
jgi:aminodeoxyfutalosine deaminase